MIELIGYMGGLLLAICAVPLAYNAILNKHAHGVSLLFLLLWLDGEVVTLAYVLLKHGFDWPLLTNYIANIFLIFIVLYYKLFPKEQI